jgi:hypothetical protein
VKKEAREKLLTYAYRKVLVVLRKHADACRPDLEAHNNDSLRDSDL